MCPTCHSGRLFCDVKYLANEAVLPIYLGNGRQDEWVVERGSHSDYQKTHIDKQTATNWWPRLFVAFHDPARPSRMK